MSFLGLSGLFGGDNGADWQAQNAQLQQSVNQQQIQQAMANAAAPQNAQGNQALAQQQAFANAVAAQNGLGNQSAVFGQEQGLANQYQNIANGQGPNPAQAMLAQQTGNNISAQAALMAGQRGAGANAGLLARQAAQQGAATQQQAVGQGATMQAQQSLAALGQLQGQQAQMANLANTQVGQQAAANQMQANTAMGLQGLNQQNALANQQTLLGAGQGQQQQALGNVQQQNQANVGIAQGNQQFQAGMIGGLANSIGGAASSLFAEGGEVKKPQKMADGGPALMDTSLGYSSPQPLTMPQMGDSAMAQSAPTLGVAPQAGPDPFGTGTTSSQLQLGANAAAQGQSSGPFTTGNSQNPMYQAGSQVGGAAGKGAKGIASLMSSSGGSGAGAGEAAAALSQGGPVKMADGGGLSSLMHLAPMIAMLAQGGEVYDEPRSYIGKHHMSKMKGVQAMDRVMMAKGGKVPALLSPGEIYLNPEQVKQVAQGLRKPTDGKKVPGQAKVKGDSLKNDVVNAKLEEGGIVLPRHVTMASDKEEKAKKFVEAVLAKKGKK